MYIKKMIVGNHLKVSWKNKIYSWRGKMKGYYINIMQDM